MSAAAHPATGIDGKARRRTQAERSAATRARLMDATIEALIEKGYSGTTTLEVVRRSGVSHGSLLHHYGTRDRLLDAALQAVYGRLRDPVVSALAELPQGPARIDALVDLFWTAFGAREFKAVLELWMAAANAETAGARRSQEAHAFNDESFALAAAIFPDLANDIPDFDVYVSLLFQSMQGMALAATTHRSPEGDRMRERLRELLKKLIRNAFAEKGPGQ